MTLREKVAQLVVVPFYGEPQKPGSPEYRRSLRWVRDLHVGGLVLVNRVRSGSVHHAEPADVAAFVNRMQRAAKVPLLVAGDFERGKSMRVVSETKFPHAMAFAATRDTALSRYAGQATARQARALGVPWIFAPVADVNSNPDNPIINTRSYGEDPEEVAAHVRAFIEGAHSDAARRVLVTVKHFPGHGDTETDSHLALAVLAADKPRLEALELAPFRAAIAQKVDAVMTAHIAVPALGDPGVPATLSAAVLTGLLRKELGFTGLTVTDALDMHGISKHWKPGEAAVRAIEAGADILLMPPDPEAAIQGVVRAVAAGRISRRRIDQSVERMLAAKVRLGMHKGRLVDVAGFKNHLDTPEDLAKAQEVADRAVTLVKNENGVVPLAAPADTCFLVLTERRGSDVGQAFTAEIRRRTPGVNIRILHPLSSADELREAARNTAACEAVAVVASVSSAAFRGSVALAGGYPELVDDLINSGRPVVLIALGNPYLVRSFTGVRAYLATYSTVPPAEIAAAKALFGEIPIRGRLPVTIPGVAKYGDGIQVARAR